MEIVLQTPGPALGSTQSPIRWVPTGFFFFCGVKPPGSLVCQPPLLSAEAKNGWSYTSTHSVCSLGVEGVRS